MNKVYLTTGAGRGIGDDFAKVALPAGHSVVATGRDPEAVTDAVGAPDCLLPASM
jgi:NAD(P)-dependent dehydrogenase (short-subunit alcohol dehydrogenase family)